MGSKIEELAAKKFIGPPKWLTSSICYETMMGSIAYGVSEDSSDMDIYGFCIPPKHMTFPHLDGEILGFGRQKERFEQYQQHHINDKDALSGKGRSHDFSIYGIVKYFQLCMDNNPNMIDSLFTPQFCILHITKIGTMVRDNRRLFLHKGSFYKFKGYAYQQLHKMKNKSPTGKRLETVEKYGFDVKYAYHLVRLIDEAEQILIHGDIDIQRNREQLKAIRRGEMTEDDIQKWFTNKERELESLYLNSSLRHNPDEDSLKQLLVNCLEEYYGSVPDTLKKNDRAIEVLKKIEQLILEG